MHTQAEKFQDLGLAGMALMLVAQAEVAEHTDDQLRLRLKPVHRHLASKPFTAKLHGWLKEKYGDDFKLIVEVEYH